MIQAEIVARVLKTSDEVPADRLGTARNLIKYVVDSPRKGKQQIERPLVSLDPTWDEAWQPRPLREVSIPEMFQDRFSLLFERIAILATERGFLHLGSVFEEKL